MKRRNFFKTIVAPVVAAVVAKPWKRAYFWDKTRTDFYDPNVAAKAFRDNLDRDMLYGGSAGSGKAEAMMFFNMNMMVQNPAQCARITGIGED